MSLAVATAACLAAGCASALAAEEPPPLASAFQGSLATTYTYDNGEGQSGKEEANLTWSATGSFDAEDHGALQPLSFSSISGKKTAEGSRIYCPGPTTDHRELTASILESPRPEDWEISETLNYPVPGWKYEVADSALFLPVAWTGKAYIGTSCEEALSEPEQLQVNELPNGYQGASCPVNEAERTQLLASLLVEPNGSAGQTRTYHQPCSGTFEGKGSWSASITVTLTVTATSPGANNTKNGPSSPPPAGISPPAPATKPTSEARRAQLKDQARADLPPALDSAWQAHGLVGALSLAHAYGISQVADSIGGAATLLGGDDAVVRAINDYRIVKDPAQPGYELLATPVSSKPPSLPSCARWRARRLSSYCHRLRAAASAMVREADTATAVDAALATTIDRDTSAIAAGSYAAAERQASHFEELQSSFEAALAAQGSAGAKVAALLRRAHVRGAATNAQAARAIKWLELQLAKSGISKSEITPLAGSALRPSRVDLLSALAQPGG
jgi:hypothetical protein